MTDTPKAGGGDDRITADELVAMFGPTIPMDAFKLLFHRTDDAGPAQVRAELQALATSPAPLATGGARIKAKLLSCGVGHGWNDATFDEIAALATSPTRVGDGGPRAVLEKIVYHAMSSAAMSRDTLDELRAKPDSVERNYTLLYLSNAVDAILKLAALRASYAGGGDKLRAALRKSTGDGWHQHGDGRWTVSVEFNDGPASIDFREAIDALDKPPPAAGAMPTFPSFWDEGEGGRTQDGGDDA